MGFKSGLHQNLPAYKLSSIIHITHFSDSIEQKFMAMNGGHLKKGKLLDLMQTIEKGSKTLIFVGTKVQCRDLAVSISSPPPPYSEN